MTQPGFSDRELGVLSKRDAWTGVRQWTPGRDGGLKGVFGQTWQSGPHRASCSVHREDHADREIPYLACGCGFWMADEFDPHEFDRMGEKPVVGIARGWGKVVGGPRGFRAERAEIAALYLAYEYVRTAPLNAPGPGKAWEGAFSTDCEKGMPEALAKLAEDERALAVKYPDALFYQSINAMLAAHPIKRKK